MTLIPSSSPGFGTPAHPLPSILPIILPPAILRPVAFRILTKRHGLTVTTSALQLLATYIGRQCGHNWRQGTAEAILTYAAQRWSGDVILNGDDGKLKAILASLDGRMQGGRITHDSKAVQHPSEKDVDDPRKLLAVVNAYQQPRFIYNVTKKHFDKDSSKPSLLPSAAGKTQVFRNRYNLIHQRLLRNESFQTSSVESLQQSYNLTPIANLLGRNGSNHLLLGLLTISPTGTLAINDLTGSIALDLTHAKTVPEDGSWFVPGMIVLVDGVYEEEEDSSYGGGLGGGGGVGGTIGGKFIGFTVGGPPCERRQVTLGVKGSNDKGDITAGGGFGWVDFLGTGSERERGQEMRKTEQRLLGEQSINVGGDGCARVVIMSEVTLDQPRTFRALRKVFSLYATAEEEDVPMTFVLMGSFASHAVMTRSDSNGSIEYKEGFDEFASVLSEYPILLQNATFIFVPGDNDGWESSFAAGATSVLPHHSVPAVFTSRIKRAFATANAEAKKSEDSTKLGGEAIWTTNPARVSLFGPSHEIVLFRDDISSRLRRKAVRFTSASARAETEGDADVDASEDVEMAIPEETENSDLHGARKLVKTILDQGYLSPFPIAERPVHWNYANALQLYPLPTAIILADSDSPPFAVTYEGCHVMNPGNLVAPGRRGVTKWIEYDLRSRAGKVMEALY